MQTCRPCCQVHLPLLFAARCLPTSEEVGSVDSQTAATEPTPSSFPSPCDDGTLVGTGLALLLPWRKWRIAGNAANAKVGSVPSTAWRRCRIADPVVKFTFLCFSLLDAFLTSPNSAEVGSVDCQTAATKPTSFPCAGGILQRAGMTLLLPGKGADVQAMLPSSPSFACRCWKPSCLRRGRLS